jgi:DNA-binding transcriptional MerR regulator/methylmalonyl-CoA mutase cobalamin-binding subunit
MTRSQEHGSPSPAHPISVVARRTGLTQDLLRAWEKRYQAVQPFRTATARRLYTDDDVDRLRLLKILVDGGRRISDVARLSVSELRTLGEEDAAEAAVVTPPHAAPNRDGRDPGPACLAKCVAAVDNLDRLALEAALAAGSCELTAPLLRGEVLEPLIAALGERWESGQWRVAQEHLASAVVRAVLWDLIRRADPGVAGAAVVVATLPGHRHEFGALLVGAVAAQQGWEVVYLGVELPAEEIAAAVRLRAARVVAISLVYPQGDARTTQEIARLRQLLGPETKLLAGGRAAESYREPLLAAGAQLTGDLQALGLRLQP